jgi:hypothetical protein
MKTTTGKLQKQYKENKYLNKKMSILGYSYATSDCTKIKWRYVAKYKAVYRGFRIILQ